MLNKEFIPLFNWQRNQFEVVHFFLSQVSFLFIQSEIVRTAKFQKRGKPNLLNIGLFATSCFELLVLEYCGSTDYIREKLLNYPEVLLNAQLGFDLVFATPKF